MNMDAKIIANLWNIDPTWSQKLLRFGDVDKSHIPKLLKLDIPRYSFHYSPTSARLIKEVRRLEIEFLEKRRHSYGVCPFEFRSDAHTQPNDHCLFCEGWEICVDCQDKRAREELTKALDSCLLYLDLHTAVPRFVSPRVWTHPFVRPSEAHGAPRNIDENKANKLKAKLATMGAQYDPTPKPRSLIIRFSDPFHGSPVGHRLNPQCFSARDTDSLLAVGAEPMISTDSSNIHNPAIATTEDGTILAAESTTSTDSTGSSRIHNPAIATTEDGTILAAESTTSTDSTDSSSIHNPAVVATEDGTIPANSTISTDSNNTQKPAIVTTEGRTIPKATATSTSQANIIVSYKPEIDEVLTENSGDDMMVSLQNFVTQMTSALQEQVREMGAEIKCVRQENLELKETVGRIQSELQKTRSELQKTRSELQKTRSELQKTRSELQKTRSELQETRSELQKTRSELQETRSELQETRSELQKTRSELQKTSELAILCIDKVTTLTEENQNLRKVVTRLSTTLNRVLDLDDDINVRCFLDSYLTKHGFQGRGRKEFIENHFRKDPVCKVMYERLFQRPKPNIHTAAHERPWALVASSLLRSSPVQAVPTTKNKLSQAEWVEVERMWKELCGKWDMEVHPTSLSSSSLDGGGDADGISGLRLRKRQEIVLHWRLLG